MIDKMFTKNEIVRELEENKEKIEAVKNLSVK